jgi:hypothetical protein
MRRAVRGLLDAPHHHLRVYVNGQRIDLPLREGTIENVTNNLCTIDDLIDGVSDVNK